MSDTPKVTIADLTDFKADPANPNKGNARGRAVLDASIDKLGAGRSLVADKDGVIVAGNKTREAMLKKGITKAVVVEVSGDTPVIVQRTDMDMSDPKGSAREYAFMDNRAGELSLTWDDKVTLDAIGAGLDTTHLWDMSELATIQGQSKAEAEKNEQEQRRIAGTAKLQERFIVPPFSVLDTKQGYWQERKRAWFALGINPVAGREFLPSSNNKGRAKHLQLAPMQNAGGSSFDPVLAELCCRWFCTPGGHVLDPFAGESTKGIVAAKLGYRYTGIELRPAQVQVNQDQALFVGVEPTWIQGDSTDLEMLLPPDECYDLMFTSPPYYDLEIYSESEKDGSAFATYETFKVWHAAIIKAACARLNDNRFAVIKVGVVRDKRTGAYNDFVSDTIHAFHDAGLVYYNEAILLTPMGTLQMRAGGSFVASRKLAKAHQNVLVFFKGDMSTIGDLFGEVEHGDLAATADETSQG